MSHFSDDMLERLRYANRWVVFSGAGISAESGIPTFRQAQTGLWAQYKPQDLATPEAFIRDPQLVWDWYMWRRQLVLKAAPNPGHLALVHIEKRVPTFTLITQNVDGLHQRAGSQQVVELHGNITRTKRFDDNRVVVPDVDDQQRPPRCPDTGSQLRPDVVWFGESLPEDALKLGMEATQTCDVFLSIGTSSVVYPAAGLIGQAIRFGATTIEINPEETPFSDAMTYRLRAAAGDLLPRLVDSIWPNSSLADERSNH